MNALGKKTVFICIVIGVLSAGLFGQAPDTLWTLTYGGPDYDDGYEIHQTSDSGYIILNTISSGAGWSDIWLLKTNVLGDTQWTKTYGCQYWDAGYAFEHTIDGGFIITGCTELSGLSMDVWLLKLNAQGDTLWTKKYGGDNGDDIGWDVKQTADSGYIIVGSTGSYGAGYLDVWLLKTDAAGDTQWTKTFGGSSIEEGYSVNQTPDGGYFIAGVTKSYGAGQSDIWLIRTNDQGDTIWTKTYGGILEDWGSKAMPANDGSFIVVGNTNANGLVSSEIWLLKIDSIGDSLWTKTIGDNTLNQAHSIKQTTDSGYIITGFTGETFAADGYLVKTDNSGNILWTKIIGSNEDDFLNSTDQTFDNGYIIVGPTYANDPGQSDVWLIKMEPDTLKIDESNNMRINSLSLDIFPNPVKKDCNIKYVLGHKGLVKISLYDIAGRLVSILANENQNSGVHFKQYNITNLPQGVYFITIDAEEYRETRKIILLK